MRPDSRGRRIAEPARPEAHHTPAEHLRFSVYGRISIKIRREGDAWVAYRADGEGKRRRDNNTVLSPDLPDGK